MNPHLPVNVEDVRTAALRIDGRVLRTPVVPFVMDSGVTIGLKAECVQRTGSFKIRGALNAMLQLDAVQRRCGVVTFSSGNHAQAIACAAFQLGIAATVVMPHGAAEVKVAATRRWGADVRLVPPEERKSACDDIARTTGAQVVPPFDDARVIAGQGTIGMEIEAQVPDVAVVYVPVGGGGLISGIAVAIKAAAPSVRVIGVEPELAGDFAEGFRLGRRSTWSVESTGRTIADGIRSTSVGVLPWQIARQLVDGAVTVSEAQIRSATRLLALHTPLVVEPTGAVALAAALRDAEMQGSKSRVAVVSGGNVDPDTFAHLLSTGLQAKPN